MFFFKLLGILFLFGVFGVTMGVRSAKKKKKRKFRPIIRDFKVSTRSKTDEVKYNCIKLLFVVELINRFPFLPVAQLSSRVPGESVSERNLPI